MPREIKTTLAVDGEQAFKRAINEANTSMKNLGTQLSLASAEFRKDGDAMKLMETRSKALNGQISQQEEIVKALEKAVSDSTKAYGENSDKTEKWEAELNRAKAKLVNLQSELALNEQGLDRSGKAFDDSSQHAADYQATLQTIGKNVSFKAVTDGITGITGTVENAIKKVLGFAKVIRDTFADAGEWADQLSTDATKYGMDTEELQRWQYAAEIIDTDVSTIINARDKMTKKMKGGWKDGDLNMWELLGVNLTDEETGKARDKMDIMWELGETLMNISEMQERGSTNLDAEALSMEVFGKSWRDLLPLFKAGRGEWEKAMSEAEVVSKERVESLTELDDANKAAKNSWDTTKYSFLAELAPVVTDVTNAVTEMLKAFNEWMDTDEGKQAMEDISNAIRELFSGLKDVKFKDAIDAVKDALNGIKDSLLWLSDNKDAIYKALEVIGGGFALLKVSDTVLRFLQLKNGLQGLTGGGNGGGGTGGTPGGGTGGTGDVAGGTAGGGFWAGIKGFFSANGLSTFAPAAVLAAAVAPAVIAQKANEAGWIGKYEETEAAATLAEAGGKDATLLRRLNEASGPKKTADGGYQRGFLGFLDMNPTQQADLVLQSLGDYKTRGMLYSDIMRYGSPDDNINGWKPWTALMRYWGEGEYKDQPLDNGEIQALVEYLRDLETKKLEGSDAASLLNDTLAEVKINTESTKAATEKVSEMDVKRFNQVPGNIETSAERGVRRGISGLRVDIDGRTAGKILAPYVNEELGRSAQ